MSYSSHRQNYRALPVVHPTSHRSVLGVLLRLVLVWALVAGLGAACALLILHLEGREAQLERAHLQGMAIGMTMCTGGDR